jgi:hypothetical protein
VVDTGAPTTYISNWILQAIGAEPTGEYHPGIGGGVTTYPGYDKIFHVGVQNGPNEWYRVKASVIDNCNTLEFDVILGLDWMRKANVRIDYARGTVY